MSLVQVINSSSQPSIPFSILDLKAQAVRLPISKAAQILLSELLTWSGERGYCWWSVPTIAKDLNWSVSVVWRKSKELQKAGLLEIIPRPGRSNYWIPLPGKTKMERIRKEAAPLADPRAPSYEKKKEKLKRSAVPDLGTYTEETPPSPEPQNVNAIKICPDKLSSVPKTATYTTLDPPISIIQPPRQSEHMPQTAVPSALVPRANTKASITPEHLFLVEEIEKITGDTWSRGHFINLVRQTDENTIYTALSITKEKISLASGVNPGAYFTATVKGLAGLRNLGQSYPPISVSVVRPPRPQGPGPRQPESIDIPEPDPEPLDIESMKKGWMLLYRPGNVGTVLNVIGRCLEGWDVARTWKTLVEERHGETEQAVFHELLDLAALKVEYTIDAGR